MTDRGERIEEGRRLLEPWALGLPWKVGASRFEEAWICDSAGQPIACLDGRRLLGEVARAKLICAAVNDYEALLDVYEAADDLRLWEPGRAGYAAALKRLHDACSHFAAGPEEGATE